MSSKFGLVVSILAVAAGCATGGDGNGGPGPESDGSPAIITAGKNRSFVTPLDSGAMNGGHLLRVDLQVPSGRIFRVDYSCGGGDACAHVFECPATARCGPDHPYGVTYDDNRAIWWGWTDSGMAQDATLEFQVHFTGAEPPPQPPC